MDLNESFGAPYMNRAAHEKAVSCTNSLIWLTKRRIGPEVLLSTGLQRCVGPTIYSRPSSTNPLSRPPVPNEPLRKSLKDKYKRERKERQDEALRGTQRNEVPNKDGKSDIWRLTIGLEIHAQLNTERKLFSGLSLILPPAMPFVS